MRRRLVPWPRSSGLAAGLAAMGVILAGCVNLPTGGTLTNVNPAQNSGVGNQLVITPTPPGPQWSAEQIVAGFLVASGANPDDLSIARDYLTRTFARAWRPNTLAPNVIDSSYKANSTEVPPHVTGGQSSDEVTVSSQHLDTLVAAGASEAGGLQVAQGPAPYVFRFELIQLDGRWRIDAIIGRTGKASDSILLLTGSDFERDYLPRNLYYLARGSRHALVPYPVYIPAQAGPLGVQQLVDAVSAPPPTPSNWLFQAIGTALLHTEPTVQVSGNTAVVQLGGAAATADRATLRAMEAQLVWTLTYAPDSPGGTGINSVNLDIGSKSEVLLQSNFPDWIPRGPPGPLYYQTLDQGGHPLLDGFTPSSDFGSPNTSKTGGTAKNRDLVLGSSKHQPLPPGFGRGQFTAVAVSPPLRLGVSDFAGCRGTKFYIAPLLAITVVESRDLPGKCTSLSWDNHGDCWVVAGSDVYVLNATVTALQVTPVIPLAQQITTADDVVSLKVAPDGLRVAIIVRGKHGSSVYVSAITKKKNGSTVVYYLAQGGPMLTVGPDVPNPIALTWWDSDHLLVLGRQGGASQLYEVPLHGVKSAKVATPTPANATSVTSDGSFIAVGTPGSGAHVPPTVLVSHGLEGPWIPVVPGSTPTYIG